MMKKLNKIEERKCYLEQQCTNSLKESFTNPSSFPTNPLYQTTKPRRFAVPDTLTLKHHKQQELQDQQLQCSQSMSHLDLDNDTISLGSPIHPMSSHLSNSINNNNHIQEQYHHSLPTILPSYTASGNSSIGVSHKHQRQTSTVNTLEEHLSSVEWKRHERLVEDWRGIIQQGRRRSIQADRIVQHDHHNNHDTAFTTPSTCTKISGNPSVAVVAPNGEDGEMALQSRQMMQVRTALLMKKRETDKRLQRTKELLQHSEAVRTAFSAMEL